MSKPIMSKAQYRVLGTCIARADENSDALALRYADTTTVRTIIAMAKPGRRWVSLNYGHDERGHRCIGSGTVTNAGRTAHRLETERRARETAARETLERALMIGASPVTPGPAPRLGITASIDPFRLCATRELELIF